MRLRLVIMCAAGLLSGSCFGPVRTYLEPSPDLKAPADASGRADSAGVVDTSGGAAALVPSVVSNPDTVTLPPTPSHLEIDAWTGTWFVALEKPLIYCNYGYDLYVCPRLDTCKGPADTALFSRYRRARCDRFAGSRLKVLEVAPRGSEWLMTFEDGKTGTKLYARTVKGVFGEVALESDLDGAKKRWLGNTVFSARGFITAFDKGAAKTIKVRLQDPLVVKDVRFGLAPLPVKPLWLMVETADGRKGTIPVWYSWTNVKKELRHPGNPWDGDVFEVNPEKTHRIDAATWDIINGHTVRVGMTRDEIRLSWGSPISTKTETVDGAELECWTYQAQRLYFDDKELVEIKENQ